MFERKAASNLQKWGLIATAIYVACLIAGIPIAVTIGWLSVTSISLNELGDFLAGAFGPLAFFWLVLGFMQQGKELQNSVDALNLQARELAASVEQQAELVAVTRETLEAERAARAEAETLRNEALVPKVEAAMTSSGGRLGRTVKVWNSGGSTALGVSGGIYRGDSQVSVVDLRALPTGQSTEFVFSDAPPLSTNKGRERIKLFYTDQFRETYSLETFL